MIYGATGYTGRLVAQRAIEVGERPILAARRAGELESLAKALGLEFRVFGLEDAGPIERALDDVGAVLHCAGPFAWTSRPMADACLATGTHYLDITGELDVFESLHARDAEAREAGVVLLPGVGFDVVPTDTVAARLSEALPDASHLELAFFSDGGGISRGTMRSMIERMPGVGAVRRDGKIIPVPLGWRSKDVEFTAGRRHTVTIPWGDVSTAFYSTGIGNIEVYTGMAPKAVARTRQMRWVVPIVGLKPIKRAAQWWIGKRVSGPDREQREAARTYLWGRVENAAGASRTATFDVQEGYTFTAVAAVNAAARVVAGEVAPGAKTPTLAFGSDYGETLPGVGTLVIQSES